MEYVIICLVSLLGSGLTLFSGFGLGTLLVPVFALFFPIELAIVFTAIVHFLNNLFKLVLLGKHINWRVAIYFGIPAIAAAFIGAELLKKLSDWEPWVTYSLGARQFRIMPVQAIIGLLLIVFSLFELIPKLSSITLHKKYLPVGGILSGFFGGLSGHQGALRSMFLIRSGLSKETFVATGVIIACMIDTSRLTVYFPQLILHQEQMDYLLVICATLSAFTGAYFGNKLLKKMTIRLLQNTVAIMLILFGILLISGIINH
jgi:uncharacterized membrane protein YfcA